MFGFAFGQAIHDAIAGHGAEAVAALVVVLLSLAAWILPTHTFLHLSRARRSASTSL